MALFDKTETRVARLDQSGPYSSLILRLHSELDRDPLPEELKNYPEELFGMIDLVYQYKGQARPKYSGISKSVLKEVEENKRSTLVAFSGGKDSVASAIHCKKRFGKDPFLYHVKGINPSYTNKEHEAAIRLARLLQFDMRVVDFHPFTGSVYAEHPIKDQVILSSMMDYGVPLGVLNYTMGVEIENTVKKSNLKYNFSDSAEMFSAFWSWARSRVSGFNWFWTIKNHSKSLKTICEYEDEVGVELLSDTISCLTPVRFQNMRRNQTMAKYGVDLIKNRCGVCWKCCVEYLNLVCLGREQPPNDQTIKHCFDRFKVSLPTAYGNGYLEKATDLEILNVAVDPKEIDNTPIRQHLGI